MNVIRPNDQNSSLKKTEEGLISNASTSNGYNYSLIGCRCSCWLVIKIKEIVRKVFNFFAEIFRTKRESTVTDSEVIGQIPKKDNICQNSNNAARIFLIERQEVLKNSQIQALANPECRQSYTQMIEVKQRVFFIIQKTLEESNKPSRVVYFSDKLKTKQTIEQLGNFVERAIVLNDLIANEKDEQKRKDKLLDYKLILTDIDLWVKTNMSRASFKYYSNAHYLTDSPKGAVEKLDRKQIADMFEKNTK